MRLAYITLGRTKSEACISLFQPTAPAQTHGIEPALNFSIAAAMIMPWLVAIASFSLIARAAARRSYLLLMPCLPILLSPYLIPVNHSLWRLLAAIGAVFLTIKIIDVWLDAKLRSAPNRREYLDFLTNPFSYVRRLLHREPRPSIKEDLWRLSKCTVGCALAIWTSTLLFAANWSESTFLTEHVVKVLIFMLIVILGSSASAALWRLFGGSARDYMDSPFAARNPADFWRRYNRNMYQFFWEDVFKPCGGRRAPVRIGLCVFALSAVMHEFIFSSAVGRLQGYQTAFFVLQGFAVAITARLKVKGLAAIPWIAGTLAFNLLSSVLFFASIHEVSPFYSRELPAWLHLP